MSCDAHGGTTSKMRPEENDDNRATTWPGAALGAGVLDAVQQTINKLVMTQTTR